ncbi:KLRD1 protein, partial [Eulacestoma nigropectus]|nr:KLRD1 protein [Eulacestoma nigropectus]
REDCGNRGSSLLVPWGRDELVKEKRTQHFWISLSVPVARTAWMWENGSDLDEDQFQLDLGKRPGACGTFKGNGIDPQNCDTRLQWLCQRESAEI